MRKKLLLADDSITIQKVVGIIFSSEDYELTIVDNGAAAVAKARENLPDVLLVDAVMPGMTGYEVCEEIRRDPVLQGIPILLMTGAFEPFDETKARQSGADDFISKPFESQHLIDKVLNLADLAGKRRGAAPAPAAAPFVKPPLTETVSSVPSEAALPPSRPAAASVAPATDEGIGFFTPEEETAPVEAPRPVPAAAPDFELEIVEGTSEDDLWGAFDLEDLAVVEGAEAEAAPFEVEALAAGADGGDEHFVFVGDEGEAIPLATTAGPGDFDPKWEPVEEAEFSFTEEAGPVSPDVAPAGPVDLFGQEPVPSVDSGPGASEDFFLEKGGGAAQEFIVEASAPLTPEFIGGSEFVSPAESGFDLQFAPEEEYVPVSEAPAPPATTPAGREAGLPVAPIQEFMPESEALTAFTTPAPPAAVPATPGFDLQFAPEEEYMPAPGALVAAPPLAPAAPSGAALSDDQLAALVSRISRDIIEKIAWEIVPDLAERIILDEIRKIKEGA